MGLIYIFTGTGKGKTSAALGMALRGVCDGKRVAWISWYKEPTWSVSEYKATEFLGPLFSMYVEGKGFYFQDHTKIKKVRVGAVVDKASQSEHIAAAHASLARMKSILQNHEADVLICDELCQAAGEGLVDAKSVIEILEKRGDTHLVLTGRNCPEELIGIADTVTEMKKIKHVYDSGIMAVKGLDF